MPSTHAPTVPVALALAASPALLEACRDGRARVAAAVVEGPAVILGARQRAGRVVDLDACARAGAPVLRRATTGTAAWVGARAIVWTVALPHAAALVADATTRTILNRNVRPFLRALTKAGAVARYFGREWIAVEHRPVAIAGYDVTRDGRVLLEVIAGWDEAVALPDALVTEAERAVDRWRGHAPLALVDAVAAGWDVGRLARSVFPDADEAQPAVAESLAREVTARDPVPEGMALGAPVRVPIGYVEAARDGGRAWLGGDLLAATWWLDDAARALLAGDALPEGCVMEGAAPEDLAGALRDAR